MHWRLRGGCRVAGVRLSTALASQCGVISVPGGACRRLDPVRSLRICMLARHPDPPPGGSPIHALRERGGERDLLRRQPSSGAVQHSVKFVVVASDGLWDVMTNQQVVHAVRCKCARTQHSLTLSLTHGTHGMPLALPRQVGKFAHAADATAACESLMEVCLCALRRGSLRGSVCNHPVSVLLRVALWCCCRRP